MPTIITHALIAGVAGSITTPRTKLFKYCFFALACSLLPDADVIGFAVGIPYGDFWGHRGFFHSIFFAVVLGFGVTVLFFREEKLFSRRFWGIAVFLSLVGTSHGLLDAMTDGGYGIALFSPFDNGRYFLPWTPIKVSPIGIERFFGQRGFAVMKNEFLRIWLPLLILWVVAFAAKKFMINRPPDVGPAA